MKYWLNVPGALQRTRLLIDLDAVPAADNVCIMVDQAGAWTLCRWPSTPVGAGWMYGGRVIETNVYFE